MVSSKPVDGFQLGPVHATHRFPLEGQGVLVVGPNRVSMAGIEMLVRTAVQLLQELWAQGAR